MFVENFHRRLANDKVVATRNKLSVIKMTRRNISLGWNFSFVYSSTSNTPSNALKMKNDSLRILEYSYLDDHRYHNFYSGKIPSPSIKRFGDFTSNGNVFSNINKRVRWFIIIFIHRNKHGNQILSLLTYTNWVTKKSLGLSFELYYE